MRLVVDMLPGLLILFFIVSVGWGMLILFRFTERTKEQKKVRKEDLIRTALYLSGIGGMSGLALGLTSLVGSNAQTDFTHNIESALSCTIVTPLLLLIGFFLLVVRMKDIYDQDQE